MKTFDYLTPEEWEEFRALSMRIRLAGSNEEKRWQDLLAKTRLFVEGTYEDEAEWI